MYHLFKISGFRPKSQAIGQMKSQARKASHDVAGCDKQVGPVIAFERYKIIYNRSLTRREMVFGVKAIHYVSGSGFAGLVAWHDHDQSVKINMVRAKSLGIQDWIVQFVRDTIVAAGWTIIEET